MCKDHFNKLFSCIGGSTTDEELQKILNRRSRNLEDWEEALTHSDEVTQQEKVHCTGEGAKGGRRVIFLSPGANIIVGQSWLSANLGFASVRVCVCVCVCVLTGKELWIY